MSARILIIEDDQGLRTMLTLLLERFIDLDPSGNTKKSTLRLELEKSRNELENELASVSGIFIARTGLAG